MEYPIKHRDALLAQQKAATVMTFQTAGERYFEEHAAGWRGQKTRLTCTNTLMGERCL